MTSPVKSNSISLLKALADETRLSVVRHIASQTDAVPSCDVVRSCSSLMELSQPTMSHHLKKLVEAGVLILEKRKTENFYRVDRDLLSQHGFDINRL